MSDVPLAAPAPAITADVLAPQLRKHVDPKAPLPLRSMGAKLLVPASPHDAACLVYLLAFDPDPGVAEQANKTAGNLPDKVAISALRDESVPPAVLLWLAGRVAESGADQLQEALILNASCPDEALTVLARSASPANCEAIGQNQLRLLRHEPLLRALLVESRASPATVDSVADFAVRSGVFLLGVAPLGAAYQRIHGKPPPSVVEVPAVSADSVLEEFKSELLEEKDEDAPELDDGKKRNLTQRIQTMSVSEKIKLAARGNKEARTLLLRDSNKLVCSAAVQSPRITQTEIVGLTNSRSVNDEVLRIIMRNREWMKIYQIKLSLVKNPKTPLPQALKLMVSLRMEDLKDLAKNKNVPSTVMNAARNQSSRPVK